MTTTKSNVASLMMQELKCININRVGIDNIFMEKRCKSSFMSVFFIFVVAHTLLPNTLCLNNTFPCSCDGKNGKFKLKTKQTTLIFLVCVCVCARTLHDASCMH